MGCWGCFLVWAFPSTALAADTVAATGEADLPRVLLLGDSIYAEMLPHAGRLHNDDGCRFTPEGSAVLARRVAGSVESMQKTDEEYGISINHGEGGRDWTVFPKETPNTWQFAAGILKCSGKPASYIRTVKDFENYHLHFEWRWPDSPGNSGVLLNVTGKDDVWPECIECQLHSGNAGDIWLGKNTELSVFKAKVHRLNFEILEFNH